MLKQLILIRLERRYYLLRMLIAFLAISLLDLNSQTGSIEIKLMTYNIFHGEQPYNPGNSNLPQIAELINKVNPDLVALQEVDSMTNRSAGINSGVPIDQVMELSRMTGMAGFFGKAIDYVFLSGNSNWIVKDVEVIRCSASDHMPVLVILEIED